MSEDAKKSNIRDLVYSSLFAVVIAICSWISFPMVIPVTLQTMGVFAAIGILGGKRGTAAVAVYILLGAMGIPVFAGFKGGVGALAGNTGGYIIGFLFSALVMWGMEKLFGKSKIVLAVSMVAGLLTCYIVGTVWFMVFYSHHTGTVGLWTVLGWCVFPFIIPDLLKIAAALYLSIRMKNMIS